MATTAAVSEAVQPPVVAYFVDGPPSPLQDFSDELRLSLEAAGVRTFRALLNQTAAASGFSNKQVVELFDADQASQEVMTAALEMFQRHGRVHRYPQFAALLGPLDTSRPWVAVSDPRAALLLFLERLIRLGRRADAARQLAVQRHQLARHAVATAPDRPPGELVVSSARVPRGPDLSRVAPAWTVEAIRGRRLIAA
ncbi:hypothetical protein [Lentzea sp. E54]|uniref:hypothetical protein n=1 Tax=Lentzea xerophila TaxID=3435883 RepID=UPI003DA23C5E